MAEVMYSEKITVYMSSAGRSRERRVLLLSRYRIGAGVSLQQL